MSSEQITRSGKLAAMEKAKRQLSFRRSWCDAMDQTSTPVKYDKTKVLMLRWDEEDDDLEVADEVEALANVLRDENHYNFKVETKVLNAKASPQAQAIMHLSTWVFAEDGDRTLLIVYYAGHGYSKASEAGTIRLAGSQPGPSINWDDVEGTLKDTRADVFIIFDCCHAGLLCRHAGRGGQTRCYEYFAACSADQTTPIPSERSFTTAVIWAFEQLKIHRPRGFRVTELEKYVSRAPNFDRTQGPEIFNHRFELGQEHIFLAPMPRAGEPSTQLVGEYRDERDAKVKDIIENGGGGAVDLRFSLKKPLTKANVKEFAQKLKKWLGDSEQDTVSCNGVEFLGSLSRKEWVARRWFNAVQEVRTQIGHLPPELASPTVMASAAGGGAEAGISRVAPEVLLGPSLPAMLRKKRVKVSSWPLPGTSSLVAKGEVRVEMERMVADELSPLLPFTRQDLGESGGEGCKVGRAESSVAFHLKAAAGQVWRKVRGAWSWFVGLTWRSCFSSAN